nr:hypothetical protein GCM10020093_034320 [Planobispora longispora]
MPGGAVGVDRLDDPVERRLGVLLRVQDGLPGPDEQRAEVVEGAYRQPEGSVLTRQPTSRSVSGRSRPACVVPMTTSSAPVSRCRSSPAAARAAAKG